jgi:hypothetical protein
MPTANKIPTWYTNKLTAPSGMGKKFGSTTPLSAAAARRRRRSRSGSAQQQPQHYFPHHSQQMGNLLNIRTRHARSQMRNGIKVNERDYAIFSITSPLSNISIVIFFN